MLVDVSINSNNISKHELRDAIAWLDNEPSKKVHLKTPEPQLIKFYLNQTRDKYTINPTLVVRKFLIVSSNLCLFFCRCGSERQKKGILTIQKTDGPPLIPTFQTCSSLVMELIRCRALPLSLIHRFPPALYVKTNKGFLLVNPQRKLDV